MNNYILNNGVLIPEIGFGTWQTPDGDTAIEAVKTALQAGYRHIDTALIYRNEQSVGKAIRESGIARKDIFVTSKLWNKARGYDTALKAFEISLKNLGMDYLDLYLIHWPANAKQFDDWEKINANSWKALEKLYAEGLVKAIGVSNFLTEHLKALEKTATILPMVNQIEFHPGYMQTETVAYCKNNNILVEAWSPLGTGKMLENETLKKIAGSYKVSVAQLCIRWILQKGHLPLPKSVTPERIKQNLEVFNFTILEKDIKTIDNLPYIGGSGLHPNEIDF
ncbi:aldo/keto reductase [Myroides indicus]|uniref:Diketogulonate reductase-like aldo/keto reductase n=1 Tax=Myroides indicus TaxID=1323422 RepID=A0A4R7EU13_9FLAO|nr:aldo/keto reductase [Myroides indicus]TDS56546.1 diketogulonate reductase-like aldo/keto reductase [Myroides indicus]